MFVDELIVILSDYVSANNEIFVVVDMWKKTEKKFKVLGDAYQY